MSPATHTHTRTHILAHTNSHTLKEGVSQDTGRTRRWEHPRGSWATQGRDLCEGHRVQGNRSGVFKAQPASQEKPRGIQTSGGVRDGNAMFVFPWEAGSPEGGFWEGDQEEGGVA